MAELFGRFWLHEKIGDGRRTVIYRATMGANPEVSNFDLAIKRLRPEYATDPALADSFLARAEVGKQLSHANVIRVYEAGTIDRSPYFVMEFVRGKNLAGLMAQLRSQGALFPTDLAILVVQQVLRALDYIHRATTPAGQAMELIHGAVSPANIYLSLAGEVKLSDPGSARVSAEGRRRGEAAYVCPEVLSGEEANQRMDLWSAAAVLFELITAEPPYGLAEDDELLLGRIPKVPPAHRVGVGVDPVLSAVLQRALHKKLRKRPKDAVTLYRSLRVYREAHGIHVDKTALGAFVRQTLGTDVPEEYLSTPTNGDFAVPNWQAPLESSITQRIQIVRRREIRFYWFLVSAGLGVGLALLLGLFVGPQKGPSPQVEPQASTPRAKKAEKVEKPEPAEKVAAALSPEQAAADQIHQVADLYADHYDLNFADADELDPTVPESVRKPFRRAMKNGRVLSKKKQYEAAAKSYRSAMRLQPKNLSPKLGLAIALFYLQRYDEADGLVDTVMHKDADNARGLLLRADLLMARANVKTPVAKKAYLQVVKRAPDSHQAKMAKKILDKW